MSVPSGGRTLKYICDELKLANIPSPTYRSVRIKLCYVGLMRVNLHISDFTVFAKNTRLKSFCLKHLPTVFFFPFLGKSSHLFLLKILQCSLQCPVFIEGKDNVLVHI